MKFDFIAENAHGPFDVKFMCRELGVSRSGYYARRQRGLSKRRREDLELVGHIRTEFDKHPRGCGSRMITGAIRASGRPVSRKRVVRLMAEENLCHRLKRRYVRPAVTKPARAVAPNVLARDFEVDAPNQRWAGDLTYIHTLRGWVYLAVVLDLGSRCIVGWQVGTTMNEQLVIDALSMALAQRRPPPGLIVHSDQGTQYTSHAYLALLQRHGLVRSMSRRANCWDNACVESFFSTLKRELPNDHVFADRNEVEPAVFAYIEATYNTRRPHSALGYRTPLAYEQLHAAT